MSSLSVRVLVTGPGHLSERVCAELLERGAHVTLVVPDPSIAKGLNSTRVEGDPMGGELRVVEGEATDDAVLDRLDLESAECLVVAGEQDRENLEIALAAHHRRPDLRMVVRLFDEGLAHALEQVTGIKALSADFLAAPTFVSAATDDAILAAFDIEGVTLALFGDEAHARRVAASNPLPIVRTGNDLRLDDGSIPPAAHDCRMWAVVQQVNGERSSGDRIGNVLSASSYERLINRRRRHKTRTLMVEGMRRLAWFPMALWQHAGVVVKALLVSSLALLLASVVVFAVFMRLSPLDAFYFVITTVTTTGYGDINLSTVGWALKLYGTLLMLAGTSSLGILFALVAEYLITARIESLLGRRDVDLRNHIVVVGLGRFGYRVAQALRALGEPVVAVESDASSDNVAAARRHMAVVIGNPSRAAVLSQIGVGRAKALIAVTDDPMRNVTVALQAREHNPQLVTVVRSFDSATTSWLGDLRFDALLSTSAVVAPMFVDAALRRDVLASFRWDDRDVLVMRWTLIAGSALTTEDDALLRRLAVPGGEAPAGLAPVLVRESHDQPLRLVQPGERVTEGRPLIVLRLREA